MTTHLHNSRDVSQFGRVGLLCGGTSSEREISLMSGEAVYGALIKIQQKSTIFFYIIVISLNVLL